MTLKTIQQSIRISASKEKVWSVLFEDHYTRTWYAEFSPGTHAITDWKEGSKAFFVDESGDGLFGKIIQNKYGEILSIEYYGEMIKGKEELVSPGAKAINGGMETYRLVVEQEEILLSIDSDMHPDYFDFMFAAWEKALQKIKQLAEKN